MKLIFYLPSHRTKLEVRFLAISILQPEKLKNDLSSEWFCFSLELNLELVSLISLSLLEWLINNLFYDWNPIVPQNPVFMDTVFQILQVIISQFNHGTPACIHFVGFKITPSTLIDNQVQIPPITLRVYYLKPFLAPISLSQDFDLKQIRYTRANLRTQVTDYRIGRTLRFILMVWSLLRQSVLNQRSWLWDLFLCYKNDHCKLPLGKREDEQTCRLFLLW